MFQIIKSPWENLFFDLIKNSKNSIYLASPFIKYNTASKIVENCGAKNIDIRFINSFKLSNFYNGASDLEALRILDSCNIKQKSVHKLHAKVFIFDNKAIITSGNLTSGGLKNNYEYGILIKDDLVDNIKQDYVTLFDDPEYPFITREIISKAEEIINSVPKEKNKNKFRDDKFFNDFNNDEMASEKFDGGIDSILKNLSSWKKDVFESLMKIETDIFKLEEVYNFESYFQKLHPDNQNVKPKIRQQLQYLRDIGLIEFVSPGLYKKLWI